MLRNSAFSLLPSAIYVSGCNAPATLRRALTHQSPNPHTLPCGRQVMDGRDCQKGGRFTSLLLCFLGGNQSDAGVDGFIGNRDVVRRRRTLEMQLGGWQVRGWSGAGPQWEVGGGGEAGSEVICGCCPEGRRSHNADQIGCRCTGTCTCIQRHTHSVRHQSSFFFHPFIPDVPPLFKLIHLEFLDLLPRSAIKTDLTSPPSSLLTCFDTPTPPREGFTFPELLNAADICC